MSCVEHKEVDTKDLEPPQASRFTKEVFVTNLFEPTEIVVLPKGQIIFTQRRGAIKQYDPATDILINYDSIPVFHEKEDGLMGIAIDPDFENNSWVYLYYSPVGERPVQFLSRFSYTRSGLKNEKLLLEVDVQRDECCHTGGSIEFGPDGLLYLSTGDNTNPFASDGFAPIDDRKGREAWDARRSSSNTNDLRGKILRIKPESNGTYSIPKGNLFEDEDPLTRPEIYVMGCRNPYRIAVDSKRGWLFWGDVGPDAKSDLAERGPRGHDEFNVAQTAGNYGWPLFVADNKPYQNYSFESDKSQGFFEPEKPLNTSPNNTGLKELPPARPAKIFYPYANSPEFPQLKNGGRNAMAGPVYYSDEYTSANKYPRFFDGRVFYFDWIRGFVFSLGLDEEGNPIDWYPFMSDQKFNNLMDMAFGPDGQLYIIEYGTGWFTRNPDARLSRIKYNAGNRPPVLQAEISKTNGTAPLEVIFDASASFDYDGDKLFFEWEIDEQKFTDTTFTYLFEKEGIYYPELTIRDQKGNKVREQYMVQVGNEAPKVSVIVEGNQTFFWPDRNVQYSVEVSDKEDGILNEGIDPKMIKFDITYYQSLDKAEVLGHQKPVNNGLTLIESLDCKGCHKVEGTSIGPSYQEVATRYQNDPKAVSYLSQKIINGGGGVWGEQAMSAHPELKAEDAKSIVNYILSLTDDQQYPLSGNYKMEKTAGMYLLQASYPDKGKKPLGSIESTDGVWLRPNIIEAADFDFSKNVQVRIGKTTKYHVQDVFHESLFGFNEIDLTEIESLKFNFLDIKQNFEIIISDKKTGNYLATLQVDKANLNRCCNQINIAYQGVADVQFLFHNPNIDNDFVELASIEFIPKQ
ncbi:MAG: cytochrome c [Cyclobacteriaceae bacterium]|jgi:cytochrome c